MAVGGELAPRLLTDAGVAPGMRLLDLGCGGGEVSLPAAGLVGPGGPVAGADPDAESLEAAPCGAREPKV